MLTLIGVNPIVDLLGGNHKNTSFILYSPATLLGKRTGMRFSIESSKIRSSARKIGYLIGQGQLINEVPLTQKFVRKHYIHALDNEGKSTI